MRVQFHVPPVLPHSLNCVGTHLLSLSHTRMPHSSRHPHPAVSLLSFLPIDSAPHTLPHFRLITAPAFIIACLPAQAVVLHPCLVGSLLLLPTTASRLPTLLLHPISHQGPLSRSYVLHSTKLPALSCGQVQLAAITELEE